MNVNILISLPLFRSQVYCPPTFLYTFYTKMLEKVHHWYNRRHGGTSFQLHQGVPHNVRNNSATSDPTLLSLRPCARPMLEPSVLECWIIIWDKKPKKQSDHALCYVANQDNIDSCKLGLKLQFEQLWTIFAQQVSSSFWCGETCVTWLIVQT